MNRLNLKEFNPAQKEAIMDFDHNLMVLACAGSGKTKTITSKIAYAVTEGIVNPRNICAVTFTNKAAGEMCDRLRALVPDIDKEATVRTFHSLGVMLLHRLGPYGGLDNDFTVLDEDAANEVLSDALGMKDGKGNTKKLLKCILDAKEHGVTLETPQEEGIRYFNSNALSNISGEYDPADWLQLMELYEAQKVKMKGMDFPDLILKTTLLLEQSEEAREWCHRRFHMVLVDEYQDSNVMQARFLHSFVSPDAQLIVVGDDDQSIYKFRGAVVDNILNFEKEFPNVRRICLQANYRSTREVLAFADDVIKNNRFRFSKTIASALGRQSDKPALITCSNRTEEVNFVVNMLKQKKLGKVAVLYRQHANVAELRTKLTAEGINFVEAGASNMMNAQSVKDMIALLQLACDHEAMMACRRLVHNAPLKIGEKAFEKILEIGGDMLDAMHTVGEENKRFKPGCEALIEAVKRVENRFCGGTNEISEDLFSYQWDIASDEEFMKKVMESIQLRPLSADELREKAREAVKVNRGVVSDNVLDDILDNADADVEMEEKEKKKEKDAQSNYVNFCQFLTMFQQRSKYCGPELIDIDVSEGELPSPKDGIKAFLAYCALRNNGELETQDCDVTLSTMHAAKGLEWDTVFIIHASDDVCPGEGRDTEELEEERRVFYVAVTRAKTRLYMSYYTTDYVMKENGVGFTKDLACSRFITDAASGLYRIISPYEADDCCEDKIRKEPVLKKEPHEYHVGDKVVNVKAKWTGIVTGLYSDGKGLKIHTSKGTTVKMQSSASILVPMMNV